MRFFQINEANRIGTSIYKKEIPEKYKQYPILGIGTTSIVLEKDSDTVIMLTKDTMKEEWLRHSNIGKYIDEFESNFYHPKLGQIPIYVFEIEKLYPIKSGPLKKIITNLRDQLDKLKVISRKRNGDIDKQKIIAHYQNLFDQDENHPMEELINFLSNYDDSQYHFDLHNGNFMRTKDNKLVFIDPIVSTEIYDAFMKPKVKTRW